MTITGKREGWRLSPFSLVFLAFDNLFDALHQRLSSSQSAVSPFKPEAGSLLPVSDQPRARGRVATAGLKRARALGTRLIHNMPAQFPGLLIFPICSTGDVTFGHVPRTIGIEADKTLLYFHVTCSDIFYVIIIKTDHLCPNINSRFRFSQYIICF